MKFHTILPQYLAKKTGGAEEISLGRQEICETEKLWVARLHVHQGATDGTSAHVANLVFTEVQRLQRVVRPVCDEKKT
jgi:hypothetical protein